MEKIVIYGKGGVGKSTVASNLSVAYAKAGKKVLQVGCDPKQDSTLRITKKRIRSVMDLVESDNLRKEDFVSEGVFNIKCIESGGPRPGRGCGGLGINKMFEILEKKKVLEDDYDVVIFDVLGDVVCGGFAAPLKEGFADKVFIVISEDIMSLYAANRILEAIKTRDSKNLRFGGFILNRMKKGICGTHISKFIDSVNSKIVLKIPDSKKIHLAERDNQTISEAFPKDIVSETFASFAEDKEDMLSNFVNDYKVLSDDEFNGLFMG